MIDLLYLWITYEYLDYLEYLWFTQDLVMISYDLQQFTYNLLIFYLCLRILLIIYL